MSNVPYIFTPGISSAIFLPPNGDFAQYTASLRLGLSGAISLSSCYDKFGVLWQWSTFETGNPAVPGTSVLGLSALTAIAVSTGITAPSSWASTESSRVTGSTGPGPYVKRWLNETPLSGNLFNKSVICSATNATWIISSNRWISVPFIAPLTLTDEFPFTLQLKDYGLEQSTVSRYFNEPLLLSVTLSTGCQPSYSPSRLNLTFPLTSIAPPIVSVYTTNRYVLTGTDVKFENLTTNINYISCLEIDFDDGKVARLYNSEITIQNFITKYDIPGFKTLKLTVYYLNPTIPSFTTTFTNIVEVLTHYDTVSPTEYRDKDEPVLLPWPTQPKVGANDWIVADNINSCVNKFLQNLDYLTARSRYYAPSSSEFFGYIGRVSDNVLSGCDIWTWEDLDPLTTALQYNVTWRDVLSAETSVNTGSLTSCGSWPQHVCDDLSNPRGLGRYCIYWNWRDRNTNFSVDSIDVTWDLTKIGQTYEKKWLYEPCDTFFDFELCDTGQWNVNIPELNRYFPNIQLNRVQSKCIYTGITSRDNALFMSLKKEIRIIPNQYDVEFCNIQTTIDDVVEFSNIENICLASDNTLYVLDSVLSKVVGFSYNPTDLFEPLNAKISWGNFGTAGDRAGFSSPQDIHIDKLDNVWIADTGNSCFKQYSKSGVWINTIFDNALLSNPPISICVDSLLNVHVLTTKEIRVYSYSGTFLYSYSFSNYITETPTKIQTSYNREIIYLATSSQVIKFFRNGVFADYIIRQQTGVTNIAGICHDEFRNLLFVSNDRIIKYNDLMMLKTFKGTPIANVWEPKQIYIHEDEYIQNWVYTKTFERLWDNIEIFRNSLQYSETGCKSYKPTIHSKEKMIVGQNEIVTTATINRSLEYLWDNLLTFMDYFDPSCK
jgi:hypothetical protein